MWCYVMQLWLQKIFGVSIVKIHRFIMATHCTVLHIYFRSVEFPSSNDKYFANNCAALHEQEHWNLDCIAGKYRREKYDSFSFRNKRGWFGMKSLAT